MQIGVGEHTMGTWRAALEGLANAEWDKISVKKEQQIHEKSGILPATTRTHARTRARGPGPRRHMTDLFRTQTEHHIPRPSHGGEKSEGRFNRKASLWVLIFR